MWTIDRMNRLLDHYGGERLERTPFFSQEIRRRSLHDILDELDVQAGMDTRGHTCRCHWRAEGVPINQVGTRIWRHERRLDGAYPFHHLGELALTT